MKTEFALWKDGAPVVTVGGSPEFARWLFGAPLADVGAGLGGAVDTATFHDLAVFDFLPQYDGVASGQLDDLQIDAGGYGIATPWRASGAIRRTITLPLVLNGLADIAALRRFFDSHHMRQIPFWLPAWVNDFGIAQDADEGAGTITVQGHACSQHYAAGNQFRFICLLARGKARECYGVTACSPSGENDVLTLSRELDSALEALVTVCCPLLLVRAADDALEYEYLSGDTIQGQIAFTECATEYPGTADSDSATTSAHFGTRPVFLYRFTGFETFYLADFGADVSAADQTWQAADIKGADISSSLDLLGDTLDVTVKTDDPEHPLLGYLDPLLCRDFTVEVWLADMDGLDALDLDAPDHVGRIEQIDLSDNGAVTLKVSSLFRTGERTIPRIQLQRLANESVYEYVSDTGFKTSGEISAISESPAYVEADAFGDRATDESDPNWFALGKVTIGTEVRLCTGQDGNRLYLNYPFRFAEAGQTAEALAGDDRRLTTWAVKFDQLENFDGFPYTPAENPSFTQLTAPAPLGGKKG